MLSGREVESLLVGILISRYILLTASAMTFSFPSRCTIVVSS